MRTQSIIRMAALILVAIAATSKCGLAQAPVHEHAAQATDLPQSENEAPASQLGQTEKRLRSYLESHGASAEPHYLLAYTLFREAKATESLAEYTRAAALSTPTAKDFEIVALDYVLLNDYEDADHWMSRSVEQQPRSEESWYELGRIKYTENRFAEATGCFQKALALEPRSVKTENNLGLALEGLGRTEEAVAAYRQAIAWQKDVPRPSEQPLLNLAIVLANRGQFREALELIVEANRISPSNAKICEQMGRIYSKLEDLPHAAASLERASALASDNAAIHFELAQVYRKQGKDSQARAEYARSAALNGTRSSTTP